MTWSVNREKLILRDRRKFDTSIIVILLHSLTRFRQDDSCLLLLDLKAPLNHGQLNVNPAFPKQLQLVSELLKSFRLNLEIIVSLQHHQSTTIQTVRRWYFHTVMWMGWSVITIYRCIWWLILVSKGSILKRLVQFVQKDRSQCEKDTFFDVAYVYIRSLRYLCWFLCSTILIITDY